MLALLLSALAFAAPIEDLRCPACDAVRGVVCGQLFNDCENEPGTTCATWVQKRETYSSCSELRAKHAVFLHRGACRDAGAESLPSSCFQTR